MTRPAGKPAFTLLEVSLAVTLALVLLVAMLTFYKQTTDVRAAVIEEAELVGAERAVMDLLTQELQAAFVYEFLGQGLEGAVDRMNFTSLTVPGGGVWLSKKITEAAEVPPERDLVLVGYRLRVSEDESGRPRVDGLERTCQRTLTARQAEEGQEIEAILLTSRIRFLRLGYWDGSAWVASWSGGDLPQAVEIVLGEEPLPERVEPAEYPYPTFRRVVYVPSAAQDRGATVIRGLGPEGGL